MEGPEKKCQSARRKCLQLKPACCLFPGIALKNEINKLLFHEASFMCKLQINLVYVHLGYFNMLGFTESTAPPYAQYCRLQLKYVGYNLNCVWNQNDRFM